MWWENLKPCQRTGFTVTSRSFCGHELTRFTLQVKSWSLTQCKALPGIPGHLWIGSSWKGLLGVSVQPHDSLLDSSFGQLFLKPLVPGLNSGPSRLPSRKSLANSHACFQICAWLMARLVNQPEGVYPTNHDWSPFAGTRLSCQFQKIVCFTQESHLIMQNVCVLVFGYSWVLSCKWELTRENVCVMPHGVRRMADVGYEVLSLMLVLLSLYFARGKSHVRGGSLVQAHVGDECIMVRVCVCTRVRACACACVWRHRRVRWECVVACSLAAKVKLHRIIIWCKNTICFVNWTITHCIEVW